jgi:hypothetical protein
MIGHGGDTRGHGDSNGIFGAPSATLARKSEDDAEHLSAAGVAGNQDVETRNRAG